MLLITASIDRCKRIVAIFFLCLLLPVGPSACLKVEEVEVLEGTLMADLQSFKKVVIHGVIACAANNPDILGTSDVFFYPQNGATDIRYYESSSLVENEWNYNSYQQVILNNVPMFNGYLRKFVMTAAIEERWCIVTFVRNDSIFLSDPIRLRHNSTETETNPALISINEDGVEPVFAWQDGIHQTTDIYFQVISDTTMDLISGTYTREKMFSFYNTSNVVLDINQGVIPELSAGSDYFFTLMAVDDDNWVNLLGKKRFTTH